MRATEDTFNPRDGIFYKRNGSNKWLGPGKNFQDGQMLSVCWCTVYIHVSNNRIIKDISSTGANDCFLEKKRSPVVPHKETERDHMIMNLKNKL